MPFGNLAMNDTTKFKLRDSLNDAGVFELYEVKDWRQCVTAREFPLAADKSLIKSCAHIELMAFLIYVSPLIGVALLTSMGVFCFMRMRMTQQKTQQNAMKAMMLFLLLSVTCCTGASASAGASMGLVRAFAGFIGVYCICISFWFVTAVEDLSERIQKVKLTVMYQTFESVVRSDYFLAAIFLHNAASSGHVLDLGVFCPSVPEMSWLPLPARRRPRQFVFNSGRFSSCLFDQRTTLDRNIGEGH